MREYLPPAFNAAINTVTKNSAPYILALVTAISAGCAEILDLRRWCEDLPTPSDCLDAGSGGSGGTKTTSKTSTFNTGGNHTGSTSTSSNTMSGSDTVSGSGGTGGTITTSSTPTVSCIDGIQNGTETDVDCGGGACKPCQPGEKCGTASDCEQVAPDGAVCETNVCKKL